MRLPIVHNRARSFTFVFIFFIAFMANLYIFVHEDPNVAAVRENFDKSGRILWPIFLMAVGGFCLLYLLVFETEGKRRLYSFYFFGLSGLFVVALFHSFWWGGYAALSVMLVVLLIIQLRPSRSAEGGQHETFR